MEQPKDADSQRAQRQEGAKFRRARSPIRREIPYGAKSRPARNPKKRIEREVPKSASACSPGIRLARNSPSLEHSFLSAVWDVAPCPPSGIPRCSGFRAVRDFAPFGISRPLEFLSPCRFRFQGRSRFIILGNAITSRICGDPQIQATVLSKPRPKPEWMKVP